MSVQDNKEMKPSAATHDGRPVPLSRRALIKGGAATLPVIMTLQSGAALARSSNLIGAAPRGSTDHRGRAYCLDTNSVYPAHGTRPVYDLGEPPYARVNVIKDHHYHVEPDRDSNVAHRPDMCRRGGTYYYRDGVYYDDGGAYGDHDGTYGEHEQTYGAHEASYDYSDSGWQKVRLPSRGIIVSATALRSVADHVRFSYF